MAEYEGQKFRQVMKNDWRAMWMDQIYDKDKGEGIASQDYASLSIVRGTVIFAARDIKIPNFNRILKDKFPENRRFENPDPRIGGWGKFIRTNLKDWISSNTIS